MSGHLQPMSNILLLVISLSRPLSTCVGSMHGFAASPQDGTITTLTLNAVATGSGDVQSTPELDSKCSPIVCQAEKITEGPTKRRTANLLS